MNFSNSLKARWTVAASAVAALAIGCSVILDLPEATQCKTDSDCTRLSAFGPSATCDLAQKICVSKSAPEGGSDGPVVAECNTNQECTTRLGAPAVCLKTAKKCHALESDICKIGPSKVEPGAGSDAGSGTPVWLDDDVILFGMYDIFAQVTSKTRLQSALLAFREVNRYANGIPGRDKPRPILLIYCDYSQDKDKGYEHLKELEIPAIIGPVHSLDFAELANNHTVPGGMLLMGTHIQTPVVTSIKDSGLVWRPAPSAVYHVPPMRALTKRFETEIRDKLGLGPTAPPNFLRLGVAARETDTIGVAYPAGIKFNNDLSDETKTSANLTAVDGGTSSTASQEQYKSVAYQVEPGSINLRAGQLADFGPNIVAAIGNEEATGVISRIENVWKTNYPAHRPYYILTNNSRTSASLTFLTAIPKPLQESAYGRIRGISFRSQTVNYPTFAGAYEREYGEALSANEDSHFAYDAAWVLIYAYYAAGDVPRVTGKDVGQGIRRLIPNSPTTPKRNVGAGLGGAAITENFGALSVGANIDLVGVASELDFNPATGDVTIESTVMEVFCLTQPLAPGGPPEFMNTGETYDAEKQTFVGPNDPEGKCYPPTFP
jgi:hypothetical protein